MSELKALRKGDEMSRDVLALLPPETPIKGVFGNDGSYNRFEATAGTVRAVLCGLYDAAYRSNQAFAAKFPDHVLSKDPRPGHRLVNREGECTAILLRDTGSAVGVPDSPGGWKSSDGLTLILGCDGDARTDPWYVSGARFEFEVQTYDNRSSALRVAAEHMRAMLAALQPLEVTP
jgi:hypothetical protein